MVLLVVIITSYYWLLFDYYSSITEDKVESKHMSIGGAQDLGSHLR